MISVSAAPSFALISVRHSLVRAYTSRCMTESKGRLNTTFDNNSPKGIVRTRSGIGLSTDQHQKTNNVYVLIMTIFPRSLSDSGDRSEHGGRASTEFADFEAHSGAIEREIGELWAALPPAQ
jgi:hypothetical protein